MPPTLRGSLAAAEAHAGLLQPPSLTPAPAAAPPVDAAARVGSITFRAMDEWCVWAGLAGWMMGG